MSGNYLIIDFVFEGPILFQLLALPRTPLPWSLHLALPLEMELQSGMG